MTAHDENKRLICPHCLKRFDTPQGVKAHQKAKRHMLFHNVEVPWAKYAKAIEARSGETSGSTEGESAVGETDLP